jgi:hypothetical protein
VEKKYCNRQGAYMIIEKKKQKGEKTGKIYFQGNRKKQ